MKRELALVTDQSGEARPYGNVGPGLSCLPFYLGQKFWIFYLNYSILQMLVNNPTENKNPWCAIKFGSTDHKWPSGHQFATSYLT